MKHPRYEVHSITGYDKALVTGEGKLSTSWWVADTWDCYREAPLYRQQGGSIVPATRGTITNRRSLAETNCDRLNREHDEWLANG